MRRQVLRRLRVPPDMEIERQAQSHHRRGTGQTTTADQRPGSQLAGRIGPGQPLSHHPARKPRRRRSRRLGRSSRRQAHQALKLLIKLIHIWWGERPREPGHEFHEPSQISTLDTRTSQLPGGASVPASRDTNLTTPREFDPRNSQLAILWWRACLRARTGRSPRADSPSRRLSCSSK